MPFKNMIPLLVLAVALAGTGVEGTGRRVCYFTNWSQYRPGNGKYIAENINATLCTHIAIAFAKMTDTLGPSEWNDESTPYNKGTFDKIADLKKTNPKLKVLLSVGGWNAHSGPFDNVLQSPFKTKRFAEQAAKYLRSKNMDGIDIDWEYPTNKEKYNTFIKTLRDVFVTEASQSGQERLLLASAVPGGKSKIDQGFDVPFVARMMDFITVMTYDLHGSWEHVTGHHSAMYAGKWETGLGRHLNVDWIMNYWHKLGVPKSKLNLGLPTYGRCFTLQSPFRSGVNSPSTGASIQGKYTREAGFLSYYEICKMLQQGAIKKYIPDQKVPYLVKGDQWCGFDDITSLKMKVEYVKSEGIGGIGVWSMALDDFNGDCGQKYPLMSAIFEKMEGKVTPGYPTIASPEKEATTTNYKPTHKLTSDVWKNWITTTTMKTTTTQPTARPCTGNKNGLYPDAQSCTHFWICVPGNGGNRYACPPKTRYDDTIKTCNHEYLVMCPNSSYTDPCTGKNGGFLADPKDCRKFWMCFNGKGYAKTCPKYTLWDQVANVCDWEDNVLCSPSSEI